MHTALKRTTVRALFHIAENPKSQKRKLSGIYYHIQIIVVRHFLIENSVLVYR